MCLVLYFNLREHEYFATTFTNLMIHVFAVTFSMTLCHLATLKDIRFAEMYGSALAGTGTVIIVTMNCSGLFGPLSD